MSRINKMIMNWWKTPRLASEVIHERKVTHLELFYDIFFSFLFAKFILDFAGNINRTTFAQFLISVFLTWYAWYQGANYMERHGHDDLRTRVFAILQMLCVGGMVVFSPERFGDTYIQFYAFFITLLAVQEYLYFGITKISNHKHIGLIKIIYGAVPLTIIFISLFFSNQVRFILLTIVLFLDVTGPFSFSFKAGMFAKNSINDMTVVTGSLVSRFSRFVMIILGNVVAALLNGVDYTNVNGEVIAFLVVSVLVVIGVWWMYFDHIPEEKPKDHTIWRVVWVTVHVFIVLSIGLLAVSFIYFMDNLDDPTKYILAFRIEGGSLILYYLSLIVLFSTLKVDDNELERIKFIKIQFSLLGSSIVILIFTIITPGTYISGIVTDLFVIAPLIFSSLLNLNDETSYGSHCIIE